MNMTYDPIRILEVMGLLLAATVLTFLIAFILVAGWQLLWQLPDRMNPNSIRRIAFPGLWRTTWTDILKRREFLGIADWFFVRFTVVGVIGILAAGLAAWLQCYDFAFGMRILALSIIFGGASLVGGWLFGLLFGVPRAVARFDSGSPPAPPSTPPDPPTNQGGASESAGAPPASTASHARANGVNTNLTDISDWLTKTIVGVGLTQLYHVPGYLWSRAGKINDAGFKWDEHGQLLVLALFIYFSLGGFWLGYVATRTLLTELLNQIDGVDLMSTQTAVLADFNMGYSDGIEPAPPGSQLAKADAALLAVPRQSLTSVLEIAAWGAAQARAGKLDEARAALEVAHSQRPNDRIYRQLLAKVLAALGDHKASQQLAPDDDWLQVFNFLYDPPPEGFTKAIDKGDALSAKEQREGGRKSASLHFWLACAFGQKYVFEQARNAPAETLAAIKARALAETRAAIAIDAAVLPALRSVWDPPPNAVDNDLAVFKDDADFKTLLAPT